MRMMLTILILTIFTSCSNNFTSGEFYFKAKEKETEKTAAGQGWSYDTIAIKEGWLKIRPDSTFNFFIHYSGSDFPGDYNGRWSVINDSLHLTDVNAIPGEPIVLSMKITSNEHLIWKEAKNSVFELFRRK